jgi:hypothetical protein
MKSCQILSALSNGVKGIEDRRGNEPSRKLSRTRFFTPSKKQEDPAIEYKKEQGIRRRR